MTDPPMYNDASAVLCHSLAIVRSLPHPGCEYSQTLKIRTSNFRKPLLSEINLGCIGFRDVSFTPPKRMV